MQLFFVGEVPTNIKSGPGIAGQISSLGLPAPTWRCRNVTKAASGADDIANLLWHFGSKSYTGHKMNFKF